AGGVRAAAATGRAAADDDRAQGEADPAGRAPRGRMRLGAEVAAARRALVHAGGERGPGGGVVLLAERLLLLYVQPLRLDHRAGGALVHDRDTLLLAGGEGERVHEVAERETLRRPALRQVHDVAQAERAGDRNGG